MSAPSNLASEHGASVRAHSWAIAIGLLLVIGIFLLPDWSGPPTAQANVAVQRARIIAIGEADPASGARQATVRLLDGDGAGTDVAADLQPVTAQTPADTYAVGDEVIIEATRSPEGTYVAVADRWRLPLILEVVGAFALLVVLIGGWRGVRALLALALTFAVVLKILLPLLMAGWDPVLLAVASATGITIVTFLLTEGWSRTTAAAIAGTFGALAITAVAAALVTGAARFSALQGNEDAGYLRLLLGGDFDLSGLLLAAIILGALGVLDDVTVTQAATVQELSRADPSASRGTLFRRAMNVGRSHIAATVNTLILAYVAASMPLLLLFAAGRQPATTLASTETISVEIIRALIGSIGIVTAVPLTTAIAAWLIRHGTPAVPTVRWKQEHEL